MVICIAVQEFTCKLDVSCVPIKISLKLHIQTTSSSAGTEGYITIQKISLLDSIYPYKGMVQDCIYCIILEKKNAWYNAIEWWKK